MRGLIDKLAMEEAAAGATWPGGTLTQGSRIFWPKDEPFFEGSYAVEGRLLLFVFLFQDVPTRLQQRDIGAVWCFTLETCPFRGTPG